MESKGLDDTDTFWSLVQAPLVRNWLQKILRAILFLCNFRMDFCFGTKAIRCQSEPEMRFLAQKAPSLSGEQDARKTMGGTLKFERHRLLSVEMCLGVNLKISTFILWDVMENLR